MEMKISVPQYSKDTGVSFEWESNFEIHTEAKDSCINIRANKEGLISLAKILLTLAGDEVPVGEHVHLDGYNSLEEGSVELILERAKL